MRKALLVLVLLAGCYDWTVPSGVIACGEHGECPEGQVCHMDGICYLPEDLPSEGEAESESESEAEAEAEAEAESESEAESEAESESESEAESEGEGEAESESESESEAEAEAESEAESESESEGECEAGSIRPTTCGLGVCQRSGWIWCRDSREVVECAPSDPSSSEDTICNADDDDCDGRVDEDYTPHECGIGVCTTDSICREDGSEVCLPFAPGHELCDSTDNNCDGVVDEGCPDLEACGNASIIGNGDFEVFPLGSWTLQTIPPAEAELTRDCASPAHNGSCSARISVARAGGISDDSVRFMQDFWLQRGEYELCLVVRADRTTYVDFDIPYGVLDRTTVTMGNLWNGYCLRVTVRDDVATGLRFLVNDLAAPVVVWLDSISLRACL